MASLAEYERDLVALESTVKKAREKCAKFHALNHEMAGVQSEALLLETEGRKELKLITKEMHRQGKLFSKDDPNSSMTTVKALLNRCDAFAVQMEDVRKIRPLTGSLFLRFFLGRVNVRVFNESDRNKLRTEYHKFKDRTTIIYILFPLAMLLVQYFQDYLKDSQWSMRFQHLWMLYYYVSLAVRENILRMNGSRINSWWITHHHMASIASLIFLTWPHGPAYLSFKQDYLYFCVLQGFVQLVQNRYQKQRHYTLMSLGKARPMDITSTETISEPPPSSFMIVLVPVFCSHILQTYIGYALLRVCFTDLNVWQNPSMYQEEMQTFATGVIAILLGVGNFYATMKALGKKLEQARGSKKDV